LSETPSPDVRSEFDRHERCKESESTEPPTGSQPKSPWNA